MIMVNILRDFYTVDIYDGDTIKNTEIVKVTEIKEITKILLQEGYSLVDVHNIRFEPVVYCELNKK